jgi:hypothetical protein
MAQLSNFPTKPQRMGVASNGFPSDLPSNFCTTITFTGKNGAVGQVVKLPLPKRLNDQQNIIWEELNLTSMALSQISGLQTAYDIGSTASGVALNPFSFMQFKRAQFKEHVLQWTLSPNSQQESDKLKQIINTLKKASLPSKNGGQGLLVDYPAEAQVTLNPSNYLFKFKPCAIQTVQVDYTGSGSLAFFNSGAPIVVNLTLQLKEKKLWFADEIQ